MSAFLYLNFSSFRILTPFYVQIYFVNLFKFIFDFLLLSELISAASIFSLMSSKHVALLLFGCWSSFSTRSCTWNRVRWLKSRAMQRRCSSTCNVYGFGILTKVSSQRWVKTTACVAWMQTNVSVFGAVWSDVWLVFYSLDIFALCSDSSHHICSRQQRLVPNLYKKYMQIG